MGELRGVLPIVQTPFDDDERIDWGVLAREVDWAFDVGANGLGTGMVTELLRLSDDERIELHARLVEFAAGRGPFFAGVGAESTRGAVRFAEEAERAGADAVMAIPPVTVALGDDELRTYFRAILDATTVPLIVQDASSYVGRSIPHSLCAGLLDEYGPDRVLFKPEASPFGPNLSALRDACGGRARIYEGSGGVMLIDSYRRGIAGTMPGMDALDAIVTIWRALEAEDEETAYRVHFPVCSLVTLQMQAGLDGFLAIEKHLLHARGLFPSTRRRGPIAWELDRETADEVDRVFAHIRRAMSDSRGDE